MSALLVGYARVSTQDQDLTAQRDALAALGVPVARTYVDHGLTGTNRDRPGLCEALAACRSGDTLVVTKLDRLARSLPDARDIVEDLTAREVKLCIGGSVHDPTDRVGRLLFNVLAMVAEFESDLIRLRTKEGMRVAKAKGHLRGRPPKLNPRQEAHLVMLHRRRAQHRRTQRPVRRRTLHRLPSHRTRPRPPKAPELFTSEKRDLIGERQPGRPPSAESRVRCRRGGVRGLLPELIESDGVLLRRWVLDDAEALSRAIAESADHLRPWMHWVAREPKTLEQRRKMLVEWERDWRSGGDVVLGIFVDDQVAGGRGLHRRLGPSGLEMGYWVHASYVGQRLATAVARLLTDAAFSVPGITHVEIHTDKANVASSAIARRLGFRFLGERPDEPTAPSELGIDCGWRMDRAAWVAGVAR